MHRARLPHSADADASLAEDVLELLTLDAAAQAQFDDSLAALLAPPACQHELMPTLAAEHFEGGGKRLRARLAWACGEALGAPADGVLSWALACEVLHNATLVHDDVQDGDTTRRGRPTIWVRHGVAQAINVGDWLFMRALAAVDESPALSDGHKLALMSALRSGLETVIAGQAAECGFRGGAMVSPADYARMVRHKTAALFVLPVFGAAIVHGQDAQQAAHIAQAFDGLGEMFQWVDDVIDLYGDKGRDAPGQDLYEGKMSGLVVTHGARHPESVEWLLALLHSPREHTLASEVARARAAFLSGGTLAAIRRHIDAIADTAAASCPPSLQRVQTALVAAIRAPLARLDADAKRALYAV